MPYRCRTDSKPRAAGAADAADAYGLGDFELDPSEQRVALLTIRAPGKVIMLHEARQKRQRQLLVPVHDVHIPDVDDLYTLALHEFHRVHAVLRFVHLCMRKPRHSIALTWVSQAWVRAPPSSDGS